MNMTMIARTVALVSSLETARIDQARRLEELFDRHYQRLHRLARRLSATHDDARDLVQETYLRAAQKPTSVPAGMSSEEAWLVRVMINLCRDRWRQQAVRRRLAPPEYTASRTTPSGEAALIARTTFGNSSGRLRGIEDPTDRERQNYEFELRTFPRVPAAKAGMADAALNRAQFRLLPALRAGETRTTVLDSSFNIAAGETVVVGTSRVQGDRALVVLLTAVAAGK